jgi:biopolymer transport protein ExbB
MGSNLGTLYAAGGWAMHPISVCAFVAIAVVAFKLQQLRAARLDVPSFLAAVRTSLLNGRVKDALDLAGRSRSPVAVLVRAGLLKQGQARSEVEDAMEAVAHYEIGRLEKGLGSLATLANVAPLLGFLGTVWGMIVAFDVVHRQGLANPGAVAGGIAQALVTTAWGLAVALVAVPFHNLFAARVAAQARSMELAASTLLETFSEMERMGTKA